MAKMVHINSWGKMRTRRTRKQITQDAIDNSQCFVNFAVAEDDLHSLIALSIEFHGDLARIPNLKNRKIPGKSFTNPEVEGRLLAMDKLFERQLSELPFAPLFGDEPVFILLYAADRSRDFDVDSCMVTIRDWLEPSKKIVGKNVRKRGWGIGVINDDSQARGLPLKWSDIHESKPYTYIEIIRRRDVDPYMLQFAERISHQKDLEHGVKHDR